MKDRNGNDLQIGHRCYYVGGGDEEWTVIGFDGGTVQIRSEGGIVQSTHPFNVGITRAPAPETLTEVVQAIAAHGPKPETTAPDVTTRAIRANGILHDAMTILREVVAKDIPAIRKQATSDLLAVDWADQGVFRALQLLESAVETLEARPDPAQQEGE